MARAKERSRSCTCGLHTGSRWSCDSLTAAPIIYRSPRSRWPAVAHYEPAARGAQARQRAALIEVVMHVEKVRKILIRGPNWVGDSVLAIPAMKAVRARFPDAEITLLVRPWVAGLFSSASFVD